MNKLKLYGAFDPGKDGAMSLIKGNEIRNFTFPKIGKEVDLLGLTDIIEKNIIYDKGITDVSFVLEDVHSVFGASAKANFQFGRICGNIEMMLIVYGIPFVKVQPKKWQKEMWEGVPEQRKPAKKDKNGKLRKGAVDTKKMSLLAAKRLFPNVDLRASERCKNAHDGIVDALLMVEYCRRHY